MDFSQDPILGSSISTTPSSIDQMAAYNEEYAKKIAEMQRRNFTLQPQQSSTPLWDEIDKIEDNLTGAQRQYLMQNQEYVNSLQYVSKLVQDEELRIIRPRIESTQQGQEALKKHLSLMQRLRKEVAQAEEHKSAMLNDYMTNHSDKTWQEYLAWYNKTKKGETKK